MYPQKLLIWIDSPCDVNQVSFDRSGRRLLHLFVNNTRCVKGPK